MKLAVVFLLKPTVFPAVLLHLLLFNPPSLNHLLLISPMNLQSLFHIKYVAHKGNPMPLWKLLAFCSLKSRCDCSTAHDFYDIEVALPGRTIFIFKSSPHLSHEKTPDADADRAPVCRSWHMWGKWMWSTNLRGCFRVRPESFPKKHQQQSCTMKRLDMCQLSRPRRHSWLVASKKHTRLEDWIIMVRMQVK